MDRGSHCGSYGEGERGTEQNLTEWSEVPRSGKRNNSGIAWFRDSVMLGYAYVLRSTKS